MESLTLDGKTAVVTGGASGIGRATVDAARQAGANVVVVDLDESLGKTAAAAVDGLFVNADVAEPGAWARVVVESTDAFGGIDLAHLNAGVTTGTDAIDQLTDAQYRRIMGPNVDGVVFGVRALVPAMQARGGGAMVATSSLAGLIAFPPDPIYTLTKHAVVGLVRALAPQLAERHITINAVCPGITDTPLIAGAKETLEASGFSIIPPSDIAAAVVACFTGTATGQAFVCQAGRGPIAYEFRQVPGPRV